jgi:hypothetical protein
MLARGVGSIHPRGSMHSRRHWRVHKTVIPMRTPNKSWACSSIVHQLLISLLNRRLLLAGKRSIHAHRVLIAERQSELRGPKLKSLNCHIGPLHTGSWRASMMSSAAPYRPSSPTTPQSGRPSPSLIPRGDSSMSMSLVLSMRKLHWLESTVRDLDGTLYIND